MSAASFKFTSTYTRLLQQGQTPSQIAPNVDASAFWYDTFALDVNAAWLLQLLSGLSKEQCLEDRRLVLAAIFQHAMRVASTALNEQPHKRNAFDTLVVLLRALLSKGLSGWEIMNTLGGSASEADSVLSSFVDTLKDIMENEEAPMAVRRRALQIALLFLCGVNQLSPGAFLLRKELLEVCFALLRTSQSASFSAECSLLLALLANYHRSDASALNAFLRGIKDARDTAALAQICVSIQVICASTVKLYQDVVDDTPPTLVASFGNLMASLRPDRALASKHVDMREQFKHLPPTQLIVLFAAHEFLSQTPTFRAVVIADAQADGDQAVPPCLHSILSCCSYLLTHGSSSPRGAAYANLALKLLAACAAHQDILVALSAEPKGKNDIWLCRHREPQLPLSSAARPALASLLDCCILWLRHNMQKRLEVPSYIACINVLHRVLNHMYIQRMRFVYHWEELWKSLLSLLDFLATKVDAGLAAPVQDLVQHILILLRAALLSSEAILPTPAAVHQLVYELVRSAPILAKHKNSLPYTSTRTSATHKRGQSLVQTASRSMAELERVINHHSDKLSGKESGKTVETVMASIRAEVDRNGIFGLSTERADGETTADTEDVLSRGEDTSASTFVSWACSDGFELVPLEFRY